MGLISNLFYATEKLSDGGDWRLWHPLSDSMRTSSGVTISPESALRASAVFACVKVLSETLASMPVKVYAKMQNGKREATEHPLYRVLHDEPNPWQTSFEFFEMMETHCGLRGNAYAIKNPGPRGAVDSLVPVHPDMVRMEKLKDGGNYVYKIRNEYGKEDVYTADEIFHLKDMTLDGVMGVSRIKYAKESVGLNLAAEEWGASLFSNGAIPPNALVTDANLTIDQRRELGKSWNEAHAGQGNHHKTAILSNGLKIQNIGLTAEDSQFLDTRKFQIQEIARIYRVPLHLIGDLERSTNNNIEQQALEFVQYTMLPWVRRWECAVNRSLIGDESYTYFAEFTVEGLLRGDIASRGKWYESMRSMGCYSANDILSKENENPIGPEGDKRFVNAALIDLKMAGDPTLMNKNQEKPVQPPSEGKNNKPKGGKLSAKLTKANSKAVLMLSEVVEKFIRGEAAETARLAKDPSKFMPRVEEYHQGQSERFLKALEPVCGILEALGVKDIASTLPSAVEGHFEASRAMLLNTSECKADELPQKVSDLVSKWPEERVKGVLKCLSL